MIALKVALIIRLSGVRRPPLSAHLAALARRVGAAIGLAALALAAAMPAGAAGARAPIPFDPAVARGFLWEARRGEARIFLYGTIHFGQQSFWPPADVQARRFRDVDVFALEADPTNAQRVVAAMQSLALFPAGEAGLDRRLPEPLRARLATRLPAMGLAPERAWRMRPWMLAQTLVAIEAVKAGLSPAYSAEAHLISFAQGRGRQVVEIEGIEQQMRLFDRLGELAQQEMLAQTLDQFDSGEAQREMLALVQAWANGDADAMEQRLARMRVSPLIGDTFMNDTLLDGRHPGMLAFIERAAASGRLYLVAVGALHFFGPNGLIELLRSRSWAITALR
jgi:uncharacterized protein